MPNWVKTKITFEDISDEKFDEIIENFVTRKTDKDAERIPDFNKIIPMPEYIYRGSIGPEEEAKYGKDNWYDWSVANWGTKWNSSFGEIDDMDHSFRFETAWAFAFPAIHKLAMLTDCQIDAIYADEDLGCNSGHYVFEQDGTFDGGVFEYDSDDAWKVIEELWGVTREEMEME